MCLKINWSVKTPWHRPSMGVARSGLWIPSAVKFHLPAKRNLPAYIVSPHSSPHPNRRAANRDDSQANPKQAPVFVFGLKFYLCDITNEKGACVYRSQSDSFSKARGELTQISFNTHAPSRPLKNEQEDLSWRCQMSITSVSNGILVTATNVPGKVPSSGFKICSFH